MPKTKSRSLELISMVLSDLQSDIKKQIDNDVEELLKASEMYRTSLSHTQLNIAKILAAIEAGQFPESKELEAMCINLENMNIPTVSGALKVLRGEGNDKANLLNKAVEECFTNLRSKLKIQASGDNQSSVVMTPVAPSTAPPVSIVFDAANVTSPPCDSNQSSHTATPVRNAQDVVAGTTKSSNNNSLTVSRTHTKVMPKPVVRLPNNSKPAALSRNDRIALLDRIAVSSTDDGSFVNFGLDDYNEVEVGRSISQISIEDDIRPEDSVSNAGSPIQTTRNSPQLNPTQITIPKNPGQSTKLVVRRPLFSKDQEIHNVSCEWMVNQFHPYQFWLRGSGNEYDELADVLANHAQYVQRISPDLIMVKLYCLAMYENQWYRAYVTKVGEKTADVIFIDYGNSERVSFSEIAVMPPEFARLNWQSFWVALTGIKPIALNNSLAAKNANRRSAWHPDALDYFRNVFQNSSNKFDCRIRAVKEKLPYFASIRMTLYDGSNILLSKDLLERNLVSPATPTEQIELVSGTNVSPDAKTESKVSVSKNPVELLSQMTSSSSVELKPQKSLSTAPQKTEESVAVSPASLPALSPAPSHAPLSSLFLNSFNKISQSNKHAIDLCPVLPSDNAIPVKMTAFNSPDDFYVTIDSNPENELFCLDQDYCANYMKPGNPNAPPAIRPGRYLLYLASKRSLYARGLVVGIEQNGEKLRVMDVDTGIVDTDVTFPDDVAALPPKYWRFSRTAFRVCLHQDDNSSRKQLRSDFEHYFKIRLVTLHLIAEISPNAKIESVVDYRTCKEPLPLVVFFIENNNRIPLENLIFSNKVEADLVASSRAEKPSSGTFADKLLDTTSDEDEDNESDMILPSNPDEYLFGYQSTDGEVVCKHYARRGHCPRGQFCSFKHVGPEDSRWTVETEEFSLVPSLDVQVGTRLLVRLPSDWQSVLENLTKNEIASNVVEFWFQLPLGSENWLNREGEMLEVMEKSNEVTSFEEGYLELELELTETLNMDVTSSRKRPHPLIPTENMHAAVRVSPRALGDDYDTAEALPWVRGSVIETLRDDYHARVRLLDYGNETILSAEHIKPLEERFAQKLPALSSMMYIKRECIDKLQEVAVPGKLLTVDVLELDHASLAPIVNVVCVERGPGSEVVITKLGKDT